MLVTFEQVWLALKLHPLVKLYHVHQRCLTPSSFAPFPLLFPFVVYIEVLHVVNAKNDFLRACQIVGSLNEDACPLKEAVFL